MFPKMYHCAECVRHRSKGNRPMGKKRISEQQNNCFSNVPQGLCTYHLCCLKHLIPTPSTWWLIPLLPSGLESLSPFWRGLYCCLISKSAMLPDLLALTIFLTYFLSKALFSSAIYVLHLLVYCLAPLPTSMGRDFAYFFPAMPTALRRGSGT